MAVLVKNQKEIEAKWIKFTKSYGFRWCIKCVRVCGVNGILLFINNRSKACIAK